MAEVNEADFKISGKISLYIIGAFITFVLGIGGLTANYCALEKRVSVLEAQMEKTCGSINHIEVINGKIETNLQHIKETL